MMEKRDTDFSKYLVLLLFHYLSVKKGDTC